MPALPVDSALEAIRAALDRSRAAVLTAAPGAGKTTRVPPALVDCGRVLLLQPRRVAARAMAKRIAEERRWTVGKEIGWHIRFDRQFARDTQLLVVTEGILTAYLHDDPLLSGVQTLIVDEFHERSVHADLGLALAKQAWLARQDLRILVMSATLDPAPVSAFLGHCPVIDVPGMLHPMTVTYAPGESVADALRALIPATRGNILCFLPGAREIAATIAAADPFARANAVDVVALHGSLDAAEQDRALAGNLGESEPATPHRDLSAVAPRAKVDARRRVIVATNVAETSLTVPGVSVVIDTGLQKVARYDADRGVDSLTTERVTLDSADQRAGRAARLGPGTVRRLWDERDRLRPHREAEIHRVDLSGPLLSIFAWGAAPDRFEWFDRPSDTRLASAVTLLERLGAIEGGQITMLGRHMQRLPLNPRLARVLIAAHGSFEGAAACAWLSEPARFDGPRPATSSDLLPILDQWSRMPHHLRRVAEHLQRVSQPIIGRDFRARIDDHELRRALLAGYPDRVARRRNGGRATLATGHGAIVGRESGVHDAEWLIALDVTSGRVSATTEAIIRLASRIEPEWLTPTTTVVTHTLSDDGMVKASAIDRYDELELRVHPIAAGDEIRARLLAEAWLQRRPDDKSQRLLQRMRFAGLDMDVQAVVATVAAQARRLDDISLTDEVLPWAMRETLKLAAPDSLLVPSGRDMTIEYDEDGTVSVAVKLQELFGLAETPRIGRARVPITFHLLAPNGRPVQTTQDLESFWMRTYPEVRKELRGRYPRHPWPDDPTTATPTHRTKRRV